MTISLIAAVADNGVIGRGGDLPWRLRSDLKRLSRLTMGHTIIAGRKTHEAIVRRRGGLLPGRRTIVITRQRGYQADGCVVAHTWDEALAHVRNEEEVFVFGGAEIYRLALPVADRLYLTRVHARVEGDTHFPDIDPAHWRVVTSTSHPAGDDDEYPTTFEILERARDRTSPAGVGADRSDR